MCSFCKMYRSLLFRSQLRNMINKFMVGAKNLASFIHGARLMILIFIILRKENLINGTRNLGLGTNSFIKEFFSINVILKLDNIKI